MKRRPAVKARLVGRDSSLLVDQGPADCWRDRAALISLWPSARRTRSGGRLLAGLEPGGQIPAHPERLAVYHVLEGRGSMVVDDERFVLAAAETQVAALKAELDDDPWVTSRRIAAARERAATERAERVRAALGALPELEAAKQRNGTPATEARASLTDPEARVMKMAGGGYRPAYNAELATDTLSQVIVGVGLTNAGSDQGQLTAMLGQLERRYDRAPDAVLVDGGFVNLAEIEALAESACGTTLYAPPPTPRDPTRDRHAPLPGDAPAVAAWRVRMGTAEAKRIAPCPEVDLSPRCCAATSATNRVSSDLIGGWLKPRHSAVPPTRSARHRPDHTGRRTMVRTTMTPPASSGVVVGVDTHKDTHVARAKDALGRRLGEQLVPSTPAGYRQLLAWARGLGEVAAFGVEGTGSYGAGLARYLRSEGEVVIEVIRPDRQARRRNGKSDPADADAAASAVLSGDAAGLPKGADGQVEMIRTLRVARSTAVKARTQAVNALKALVVTAPSDLREQL